MSDSRDSLDDSVEGNLNGTDNILREDSSPHAIFKDSDSDNSGSDDDGSDQPQSFLGKGKRVIKRARRKVKHLKQKVSKSMDEYRDSSASDSEHIRSKMRDSPPSSGRKSSSDSYQENLEGASPKDELDGERGTKRRRSQSALSSTGADRRLDDSSEFISNAYNPHADAGAPTQQPRPATSGRPDSFSSSPVLEPSDRHQHPRSMPTGPAVPDTNFH